MPRRPPVPAALTSSPRERPRIYVPRLAPVNPQLPAPPRPPGRRLPSVLRKTCAFTVATGLRRGYSQMIVLPTGRRRRDGELVRVSTGGRGEDEQAALAD